LRREKMIRNAMRELERALSRRDFVRMTVKGAGLVAAVDRFGEKLFGVQPSGAADDRTPLATYSAIGNLVIPVDEDPGWATFEPGISEYGLNVFLKQVFFAGDANVFQAILGTYNAFDEAPRQLGYGPKFTQMNPDLQSQYFSDVLSGQFENDGLHDILFLAAFLAVFSTKAVFFSNYPYHLADPDSEFQVRPQTGVRTGWDVMRFKGPVGPEEEKALRKAYANIEVLPGVDPTNPYI